MQKLIDDVKAFHRACDVPVLALPCVPPPERQALRKKLLLEEFQEFLRAHSDEDIVGVADALADIIYVAVGTALEYGIPLADVWAEVQRSNMSKLVNGVALKREDGKVLKGPGYTPPDIEGVLHHVNT